MILYEDFQRLEKSAKEKQAARNKAAVLILDAKARYIKQKTRARSKKQASEKDAILNGPRYKCLEDYRKPSEIQDAYGYDAITSAERDRLFDLWEEREELKKKMPDGVYSDLVTECFDEAKRAVDGMYEEEIGEFEIIKREWDAEMEKIEKERHEMHEEYKAWKNGWGKYKQEVH